MKTANLNRIELPIVRGNFNGDQRMTRACSRDKDFVEFIPHHRYFSLKPTGWKAMYKYLVVVL
ncbi:hypothetical protein HZS_656 [Henneguya salminicola]|nr:hypothetical protein HZS_656 [Henneguya salminicola]